LKEKSLENIYKKKLAVTILLALIMITMTIRMAVARTHSGHESIKDCFYKSVNYEPIKGLLSFAIPADIPQDYRFFLHISGRIFMWDRSNGMSFHAFDKESINYSWENGKTYTYPLKSNALDFIELEFGLIDNNRRLLNSYTIHIFPDGTKIM
jgi:hypothetical protein